MALDAGLWYYAIGTTKKENNNVQFPKQTIP